MIESIFFNPWVWILGGILAVLILATLAGLVLEWSSVADGGGYFTAVFAGLFALILAGIYFGAILPPYDASFYQTYRITGTLEQIDSALTGGDGTMSQVFIAQVAGVDEFIRSDDQRFRTLEAGDSIDFVCSKGFAYFQEPWYSCAIGSAVTR